MLVRITHLRMRRRITSNRCAPTIAGRHLSPPMCPQRQEASRVNTEQHIKDQGQVFLEMLTCYIEHANVLKFSGTVHIQ